MAYDPLPELSKLDIDRVLNLDQEHLFSSPISSRCSLSPVMSQENDIEHWQPRDVEQWLENLCHMYKLDNRNLYHFSTYTGYQLLRMTENDFQIRDPCNGRLFYQKLRERHDRNDRGTLSPSSPSALYDGLHYSGGSPRTYHNLETPYSGGATAAPVRYPQSDEYWQETYINNSDGFPLTNLPSTSDGPDHFFNYTQNLEDIHVSEDISDIFYPDDYPEEAPSPMQPHQQYVNYSPSSSSHTPYAETPVNPHAMSPYPYPFPMGSTCIKQEPEQSPSPPKAKKGPKRPRGERGQKLFEFLLHLLEDPNSNPSIIRWEHKEDLSFRLVDQHQVAKLWGERRPRTKTNDLSYEHFARAMRYYYKTGRLVSVPDKKLVCKFGWDVYNRVAR